MNAGTVSCSGDAECARGVVLAMASNGMPKIAERNRVRKILATALFACALIGSTPGVRAAAGPLSADDVTLLLIGGASPQKMVALIQQRGVDFKLNPDLVKQFYQDGATDAVIDALQKASQNAKSAPVPATQSNNPAPPLPPASGPGEVPIPHTKTSAGPEGSEGSAPVSQGSSDRSSSPASRPVATASAPQAPQVGPPRAQSHNAPPPTSNTPLSNPRPAEIQHIIQAFAAKEELFKEARNNYTYHQINKVETLDADGNVTGVWEQDWDILFDQNGQRVERVTYAPEDTLKGLIVTEQDLEGLRNVQPFVLTTETLPQYDVRYLGHVYVPDITTYVFSVRPKEIKKHHLYFLGTIWVDDHDFQIVKAEGRMVPQQLHGKNGQNLFPRFSTYRQQIDGKYWFPTLTLANDTLYFDSGPIRIREIIKYTDYKQFKSKVKILPATEISQPDSPAKPKK